MFDSILLLMIILALCLIAVSGQQSTAQCDDCQGHEIGEHWCDTETASQTGLQPKR